ncbi:CDP-glycerol glycerophosphotransferase family protein [Bacillus atrophaeus]|nr:CDP-glycerol glycerophosphotransferase family protein [Bacillus atrophaeus]
MLFQLFALLPRNNKLILFESYSGKQFSCNPRAIYEYLQENKDRYDNKLIWSIDKRYVRGFKFPRRSAWVFGGNKRGTYF